MANNILYHGNVLYHKSFGCNIQVAWYYCTPRRYKDTEGRQYILSFCYYYHIMWEAETKGACHELMGLNSTKWETFNTGRREGD